MGENRNYAALDWVIGEIEETLKQARQALEAYVEDPKDSTRIRFCLTHIHQVHGSLQMVEFFGAALLAEEMERLAQALMNEAVSNSAEAQEVLMRAILQLPVYLDQVKSARRDHPSMVLPLLNDLRAVRGESLLTETKLFAPDLKRAHQVRGERPPVNRDNAQFVDVLGKLRKMYQYSAAGVIRNVNLEENYVYLNKVFARLYKVTQGTARQPLWDIALALGEGLACDAIEASVSVKNLLRQLDKEIKLLALNGIGALGEYTSDELIKNMLYYVARSGEGGAHLKRIKKIYGLGASLLETNEQTEQAEQSQALLSTPDPDAVRSVVAALKDELDAIKHALDVVLSGHDNGNALDEALPIIKRVADTMAVLGIGHLRKEILAQSDILESAAASDDLSNEVLMGVASKIIEIEGSLESLVVGVGKPGKIKERDIHIDRAQESVLRESRNGLEQAKDAIIEYISSQWDCDHLINVPKLLGEIRGGLEMVPLPRPARILSACARYIKEQLLEQKITPEWSTLDTLADAIASVEYYLERLSGDHDEDDELLLSVAEESVDALGYRVADAETAATVTPIPSIRNGSHEEKVEPPLATVKVADNDLSSHGFEPSGEKSVEADSDYDVGVSAAEAETTEPAATDGNSAFVKSAAEETIHTDSVSDHRVADNMAFESALFDHGNDNNISHNFADPFDPKAAEHAPQPELSIENALTENVSADVGDEDEVDDEILEIFVEEATEVLQTINEFFPPWAEDFNDNESLTEFRRAFHTLKGSGRMVEAVDIGELAWSIENMLNRVIDGSIIPDDHLVGLIEMVRQLLPALIEAFRNKQANPEKELAEKYMAWGHALSKGTCPLELKLEIDSGEDPIETGFDDLMQVDEVAAGADWEPEFYPAVETTSVAESVNAIGETAPDSVLEDRVETASEDDEDTEGDTLLWEIFGSEALSHLQVVEDYVREMDEAAPLYTCPSDSMQRALHTLKGSAHMADVKPIAELATPLERFVKELRTYQVSINDDILQLIKDGVVYTREALEQIEGGEMVNIPRLQQFLARVAELKELSVGHLIRQKEASVAGSKKVDPGLLSIFMAEEMNLLLGAEQIIDRWREDGCDLQQRDNLVDELATLERGSEHANLAVMSNLSGQLRRLYERVDIRRYGADPELCDLLKRGHEELLDMVDAVAAGQNLQEVPMDLQNELEAFLALASVQEMEPEQTPVLEEPFDSGEAEVSDEVEASGEVYATDSAEAAAPFQVEETLATDYAGETETNRVAPDAVEPVVEQQWLTEATERLVSENELDEADAEILEIFTEEADELLEEIDESIHDWEEEWGNTSSIEELKRALHTFKGGARLAGLMGIGELAHEFETFLIDLGEDNSAIDNSFFDRLHDYQDQLLKGTEIVKARLAGQLPKGMAEVMRAQSNERELLKEPGEQEQGDAFQSWSYSAELQNDTSAEWGAGNAANETESEKGTQEIENTLPEAEQEERDAQYWSDDKPAYLDREIDVADTSGAASGSVVAGTETSVKERNTDEDFTAETKEPASADESGLQTPGADILPFTPKSKEPQKPQRVPSKPAKLPPEIAFPQTFTSGSGTAQLAARRSGPQEVVKVSADLLEELVNLAGETSISRGRMEEQVSELGYAIEEMDATIQRLQEQLRRLDIETEAQVLFRQEQLAEHEDFDPLEMDRYSQLQQLSRSLIESASDLMDLKSTLTDKTRDAETLLLQQSRINTELQEGLMRSRMVPFSRLVPRLRRIVRQISGELSKHVTFELDNVEGELDRSVLERMVAPLEHMLRNAVDHGIEPAEERSKAGKPEIGRIVLSLSREGGDVLIRLADDGRGIDLEKVRAKAIESGLMREDANLADQDILQFIIRAGFSTAEKVTQISGRGVGMDVVHSEIKQLGGSMQINSRWGEGSEFVVRLPFTVSVNRALMVQIGEDRYAIPLNTIEGIVRVSPFELEHYYQDEHARFEYAGENYQVRYLGTLLNADTRPKLEGQALPMPVVLVRSAENTVALQVDNLLGSREIVVKSLGQQFSTVQGLSGATVMGDGSVVVILDLHAMIRQEAALVHFSTPLLQSDESVSEANDSQTVMVIDDSVTVRKVTSRFLEREGFYVITAKDGNDALRILQDCIPHIMLLDIEMPRMDGFEVAKNVRSSSRLKHIPIIMITSRTGKKHRDRALSLGVQRYMGKPYQEDALLDNIRELIGETVE